MKIGSHLPILNVATMDYINKTANSTKENNHKWDAFSFIHDQKFNWITRRHW